MAELKMPKAVATLDTLQDELAEVRRLERGKGFEELTGQVEVFQQNLHSRIQLYHIIPQLSSRFLLCHVLADFCCLYQGCVTSRQFAPRLPLW